jgi:hypothetical protein
VYTHYCGISILYSLPGHRKAEEVGLEFGTTTRRKETYAEVSSRKGTPSLLQTSVVKEKA